MTDAGRGGLSSGSRWRSLLDGPLRERAEAGIADGAGRRAPTEIVDCSLAGGDAGLGVFRAYLAEHRDSDAEREEAVRLAEDALVAAAGSEAHVSLYEGLVGTAWVLAHLDGWILDLGEVDPCRAVDLAVLDLLRTRPWQLDYDLSGGLVGIGVYALERLPRREAVHALELIVAHLAVLAEHDADRTTWHTAPERLPEHQRHEAPSGYYDLGVAHGVPGVIALLAASAGAGIAVDEATRLLDGAVRWLLAQQLPGGGFASLVAPGAAARRSRSAWCYGDPGVAGTLLLASTIAGRDDWRTSAVEIAAGAAKRSDENSGVVDAGVCHGAAGLAHIYNRLWQQTGDERLERAARHWVTRTLDLLPATPQAGFLEGRAGAALMLLAATGTEPAWDRILLLSAR